MNAEAKPLVSIVMPSYNQGRFLAEAIESVLDQEYPNLELLVLDGGSTDDSVDIIRSYEDRLAYWVSERDGGQPNALNNGFARARGELLGWLNSDDTLLPGAVTAVVGALEARDDALLAFGGTYETDENGDRLRYVPPFEMSVDEMLRTSTYMTNQQGCLFRRRALELVGPMQEHRDLYFDAWFWISVALAGPVIAVHRPLATYRLHEASKTVMVSRDKALEYAHLTDDVFAALPPESPLRRYEREGRAHSRVWAAVLFDAAKDPRTARAYALEAARLYPRIVSRRWLWLLLRSLVPSRLRERLV